MGPNNRTNGTFANRGPGGTGKDKATVRIPPPVISLMGIGLGMLAHFFVVPLTAPDLWPALRMCSGVFLGLGGIAAIAVSFTHFRRTGQSPEPWTPTPVIIREGAYRYSRNPMYIGLALIQCGIGVSTGVFWITVMVLPAMIALHYLAVMPEEEYLERKFGEEYLRYKSSVRRWI